MTTEMNKFTPPPEPPRRWLILMRHAKSEWGNENLSDHQRPLNRRGRVDAPAMAQWLTQVDAVPETVLSSAAMRTRETVDEMLEIWDCQPIVSFSESLYLASPEGILETIRGEAGDAARVLIVAHNPGVSQLASRMAGQPIEMPTAAIAIFRVHVPRWSKLTMDSDAELAHSMYPKAL